VQVEHQHSSKPFFSIHADTALVHPMHRSMVPMIIGEYFQRKFSCYNKLTI